ncbi:uncharacterized protein LOC115948831 [Geospiza fortis]|uniref:Uncharacterized protein LOC115948831 n=1 Tax=Geospiza fortis TaxID=48883 RepID=A0A8N5I3Y1_GEOFO|nr:uncharacterized protein LOC115948831 [Geospiza fortis]XP_030919854.1 uncharacterized protein LOC115948831 [Geospiza fortis]
MPAPGADLPPFPHPCQPLGKQESCCGPWSSSPAPPDVPGRAPELSLHGLALEIRRDNDVSSLSFFCILFYFFFCLHKKETQPKEPHGSSMAGGPSWLRDPGEEAAAETPQHSAPSVQSDPQEGGKNQKKEKHFCSLTSRPDSRVHTSAWKLRGWNHETKRQTLGWADAGSDLPGWICSCSTRRSLGCARGKDGSGLCQGQVQPWAVPWAGPALGWCQGQVQLWVGTHSCARLVGRWGCPGQTRRWPRVAVKGVWGLLVGVFTLLGAWGYFIIIIFCIFFLSGSLSFISPLPQTVVSGKLLLIFKRQREE